MYDSVFFLNSLFPDELRRSIINSSIGAVGNANDLFQKELCRGLKCWFPKIFIINMPNVGSYPFRYRKIYVCIKNIDIKLCGNIEGVSISFLNISILKFFFRYLNIRKYFSLLEKKTGKQLLFVYDLHAPFLLAAINLKIKNPLVKICVIVPDLPEYTGIDDAFLNKIYLFLSGKLISYCVKYIDIFVFMSNYMPEKIKINKKPYIVIEGIVSDICMNINDRRKNKEEKIILYSGALNKRNGVDRLVEAFMRIKPVDYRLIICGDGELKESIKHYSQLDKRIDYLGQINQEEVFEQQSKATLLVNPRMPDQTFTRYSFPSKMMEYLASGNPVLSYKLDGIPDEYFDYCYVLENNSIEALAEKIISICEKDKEERDSFGRKAKKFISEKNAVSQCKKIKELVENLQDDI